MIGAIVGNLGTGKTATLTYLGAEYRRNGNDIYSNYYLGYKYTPVTTYQSFDKVHNGYFLGDELWSWADSRNSLSATNDFVNEILLASRKRGINIVYTTQHFGQIDKRVRDLTQYLIYPQIKYIKDGHELKFKQDFLKPINMKPYLKYAVVEALVTYASSAEYQLILESDVAYRLEFLLEPYVKLYDTTQEIGALAWSERGAGDDREMKFVFTLKPLYLENDIIDTENSGQDQDTLDVEMQTEDGLLIFDVVKFTYKKDIDYYYFHFNNKTYKRFKDIEKKRNATTLFAFESFPGNNDWYTATAEGVFTLAEGRRTIPRDKLMLIAKKVDGNTFKPSPPILLQTQTRQ